MIGRNSMKLNQATVKAAVQMYLNSQRHPELPPLIVHSVERATNGRTNAGEDFDVEVEPKSDVDSTQ